ncbi:MULTISPECIES: SAF domain-containing protein [Amycolatopsis]|uniref:SAF domain-containing protein n=1 Tax=Amycolatopsis echigonensis TaxID=2576905 RepID=A0A2N3WLN1_9PSEU|nr:MULTISPECIES: SAF domain-containing protein [Amycolatopsis]MBB2500747.1 SAF domain-containing protein [Amycolatopsis echigonensis]MCG3751295.1 SAF domain-containing protein [Amycolatopsis sp. Poz14]PKV94760.1 hypothetical protein ATK30_5645 [Amycolatopsis niigatensis]
MSTPPSTRTDTAGTATAPPDAWAQRGGKQEPPSRWKTVRPSRRIPYLLLGVVLVIACAAAAVIVSIQLDNRQPVLVLARPVTVGHLLSAPDFRQVSVSADVGLDAVPAAESSTVVGRPAAFSLPAGTLLTRGSLGPPAIPVDGQAIAAVALKAGQFPPALAPGARVAVLVSSGSASTGTASSNPGQVAVPIAQWTATVSDVGAGPDPQSTVVSLQLPEANARQLAAAPAGQVSLVALSGGGG